MARDLGDAVVSPEVLPVGGVGEGAASDVEVAVVGVGKRTCGKAG